MTEVQRQDLSVRRVQCATDNGGESVDPNTMIALLLQLGDKLLSALAVRVREALRATPG